MKIALIILHADAARGGAERYTLDVAKALVHRGHDVSILASSFQTEPIVGTRILIGTGRAITRTGRYRAFQAGVIREISRHGDPLPAPFDVVHAMLPLNSCDVYHPHAGIAREAISSGHLKKSGAVRQAAAWIGNHTNLRRRWFSSVEKKMLAQTPKQSPVVLCLSNLIKQVVRNHYPHLAESKLIPLFNGIDLAKFDPVVRRDSRQQIRDRFSITHDETVGLMLAQDFERKGLAAAIQALAKTPGPVLLVGGRPDPTKYRQLARSLGVADRVIFAGQVDDPVAFYQAADFFVLPTRFDPCSLVVLEALAMGLPVISTQENGACEIMQDGVHGRVLHDADDGPALVSAMLEMTDPLQRRQMSRACVELRPALSMKGHLDRLEQVYSQIVSKPKT